VNVLILSARPGWHTDELCRALAAHGLVGRVMAYERLVADIAGRAASLRVAPASASAAGPEPAAIPVLDADAVLARIVPEGSLEQIIYRVDVLHWIEDRGIPVMNSARAIERAVDKFLTTALLHEAGLATPETVVCESAADAMAAVIRMLDDGAEVIIKPLFGSMGHGLVRVSDREVAWRVVRTLRQLKSVFYVQRAIEHRGGDIRAFVIGGRVLAAIERTAPAGDWRTNVARGGTARSVDLPASWQDMAVRAAVAVGAEYAGVDLIESHDGQAYVIEVNAIPGWQGLQHATGIDVAAAIVDHLLARGRVGMRAVSVGGPA
jgi:ribosomal protein S6--L-glutamate ligase